MLLRQFCFTPCIRHRCRSLLANGRAPTCSSAAACTRSAPGLRPQPPLLSCRQHQQQQTVRPPRVLPPVQLAPLIALPPPPAPPAPPVPRLIHPCRSSLLLLPSQPAPSGRCTQQPLLRQASAAAMAAAAARAPQQSQRQQRQSRQQSPGQRVPNALRPPSPSMPPPPSSGSSRPRPGPPGAPAGCRGDGGAAAARAARRPRSTTCKPSRPTLTWPSC